MIELKFNAVNDIEQVTEEITIKLYNKLEDCVAAHFTVPVDEVSEICGYDGNGRQYKFSVEEMIENIKEKGCWGFCSDKHEIHAWVAPGCEMDNLIEFLGHERGHMLKPDYKQQKKEELKAGRYGSAALFAYTVGKELIKRVNQ